MGLQQFERRLERLVEGVFAKAFRSGLQPVEIGRRLTREMDLRRTVAPKGTLTPNRFTVALSAPDRDRFAPIEDELISELTSVAKDHARSEGYGFVGSISIAISTDKELKAGMLLVAGEMAPSAGPSSRSASASPAPAPARPKVPGGAVPVPAPERDLPLDAAGLGPGAAPAAGANRWPESRLLLPDGRRLVLGARPFTIGRLPECELVVGDPNVSRRHAEIRPAGGGGYEVADLGSTNGTKVNGVVIPWPQRLVPGDDISVGATTVRFEMS